MLDKLELIHQRFEHINELISDVRIMSDMKQYASLMKERSSIEETVEKYQQLKKTIENINQLKELSKDKDKEIAEMAAMELEEEQENKIRLEEEIKILLIPKEENDEKNVIVEIRGAAGGEEGNIFAADLFRMYTRYAESKGWKVEVIDSMETGLGGFTSIEFMISGDHVYSLMKYESGSHRVQRIPVTESNGRIQTSTATVLVMPEADEVDVQVSLSDVRIDYFCSSGPGGQSVNTTKSAVRLTHVPTGLVVSCQDGKSQHENKANALKVLQARLYDKTMQERMEKEGKERLSKIGRGDRSEKIRTYNYPQNRVTDHRIGFTIQQLDRIMEGKMDSVFEALVQEDQKRILSGEQA